MKNVPLLVGTLIVTLLMVVGIAFLFSKSSEPKKVDTQVLMNSIRHKKGPEQPKVTVIEFSDFQCPGCRAAQPLVNQLTETYPNDVLFIYRQFPLVQIHNHSLQAAEFAEAAGTMGKFFEVGDLLFTNQDEWAPLKTTEEVKQKFFEYADKLQIDKTELQKRIDSQEVKDAVKTDMSDGNKLGVDGTPTFYVNNQQVAAPDLMKTVQDLLTSPQSTP